MTEEDELQMALAMSVEDISQPQASTSAPAVVAAQAPAAANGPAPVSSSPTKATHNGMHERENASAVANGAAHQVTPCSDCAECGNTCNNVRNDVCDSVCDNECNSIRNNVICNQLM